MGAKLAICLLTYARTDYALKTLGSTLDKLKLNGSVHVHIADDGSKAEHLDAILGMVRENIRLGRVADCTCSNSDRGGYGKNVNLATQVLHDVADYVLMLEDDWELTRELDVDSLIADMEACDNIGCVRLGYLSFTQQLMGHLVDVNAHKYLILNPGSPEPHVFAGHPRLESVAYQRMVGPWPEGLNPGETEFSVAHRLSARMGVAWPLDLIRTWGDMFAHIGTVRAY